MYLPGIQYFSGQMIRLEQTFEVLKWSKNRYHHLLES